MDKIKKVSFQEKNIHKNSSIAENIIEHSVASEEESIKKHVSSNTHLNVEPDKAEEELVFKNIPETKDISLKRKNKTVEKKYNNYVTNNKRESSETLKEQNANKENNVAYDTEIKPNSINAATISHTDFNYLNNKTDIGTENSGSKFFYSYTDQDKSEKSKDRRKQLAKFKSGVKSSFSKYNTDTSNDINTGGENIRGTERPGFVNFSSKVIKSSVSKFKLGTSKIMKESDKAAQTDDIGYNVPLTDRVKDDLNTGLSATSIVTKPVMAGLKIAGNLFMSMTPVPKIVIMFVAGIILFMILSFAIIIGIFTSSPIGKFVAFKQGIEDMFRDNAPETEEISIRDELDKLYDEFEIASGIDEKDFIISVESDYSGYWSSDGRAENFNDVIGLYYCLLYDRDGHKADYEKTDIELLKKAFNTLTFYSSMKKEVIINAQSSTTDRLLGECEIDFLPDAGADSIKFYVPQRLFSSYTVCGKANEIYVDIIGIETDTDFSIRDCNIIISDEISDKISVVYPQDNMQQLIDSFFPGKANLVFENPVEIYLSSKSKTHLKSEGFNELTVTLKKLSNTYPFKDAATVSMAEDIIAEIENTNNLPAGKQYEEDIQKVMDFAFSKLGAPYSQAYRNDGVHYDCSSFTYYSYLNGKNIKLQYGGSNTAASQAQYCYSNNKIIASAYDKEKMLPGDLIFYSSKNNGRFMNITHVAMYCGDGMIIDASYSKKKVVYRKIVNIDQIVAVGRP